MGYPVAEHALIVLKWSKPGWIHGSKMMAQKCISEKRYREMISCAYGGAKLFPIGRARQVQKKMTGANTSACWISEGGAKLTKKLLLCPLYPEGGLQLAHSCGGTDAAGGIPASEWAWKARCASGWEGKSSISLMPTIWTTFVSSAAQWRNWTRLWEIMSEPKSSMTYGRMRTKRAIISTFRNRLCNKRSLSTLKIKESRSWINEV